jgi:hypothetical protein
MNWLLGELNGQIPFVGCCSTQEQQRYWMLEQSLSRTVLSAPLPNGPGDSLGGGE